MNNSGTIKSRQRFSSPIESAPSWLSPPEDLGLEDDEVHVWLASLRGENTEEFEEIISSDERVKAERFRLAAHRNQFIAGRGLLRVILSRYLEMKPEQLSFEYSMNGKPSISGELGDDIKFNLSHSGDLGVYAFSRRREIGIDIEAIQSFLLDKQTVARCLTKKETEFLNMLPENSRARFFYNCWTVKEAYLKASGKGLTFPANQIETLSFQNFSTISGENERKINGKEGWSIQRLPSIKGYAAALAVEGNFKNRFWKRVSN